MTRLAPSVWDVHAARWHSVGPPLRPGIADLQAFQRALTNLACEREHVRALLLGVTPELTGLDWPVHSELVAVDHSQAMWRRHWSPPHGIASTMILGEWRQMPLRSESMDGVLADGSLSIQSNSNDLAELLAQLARVLRDEGRLIVRTFVRPQVRERPQQVIAALRRRECGSFDAFKWRLLMSLHRSSAEGVALNCVHRAFHRAVPDPRELSQQLGWSEDSIDTIESYRDARGRYFFPSLAQLRELLREHFVELDCSVPDYELGSCCPLLVLSRKARPRRTA